jgi:hypothetical protein
LPVQLTYCHQIQPSATDSTSSQQLDLRAIQQQDTKISAWIEHVKNGVRPKKEVLSDDIDKILHGNLRKLQVSYDLLMRVTAEDNGTEHHQVVVPKDVLHVILDNLRGSLKIRALLS